MKRYFSYIHKGLLALMLPLVLTGCSNDDFGDNLTPEQQELIGRAVNFSATIAEPFTTRTTYEHNGVFNDDDIMYIYRQYYDTETKAFDWATEDFHAYYFRRKYASGSTNISLGRDWVVAYSDKNSNGNYKDNYLVRYKGKYSANGSDRTLTKSIQTEADSITWENGKTLRYRAWSRSNNSNAARNGSKSTYYPDFEISDWVNVSGPTNDIPLTLRHIGSRIMISHKNSGNQLAWAEISIDPKDYKRLDNAGKTDDDNADMTYPKTFKDANGNDITINSAEDAAAAVKAVYDRMCIPAGVDLDEGSLKGMTKAAYNETENFSKIEEWEYDDTKKSNLVGFGTKTAAQIATDVQRPVFTGSVNSRLHLITIPYDMSNGNNTSGEILTLPAWTRIKIWLTDVNGGDKFNTDYKRESDYHIFALDDIKKNGAAVYPNGLEMHPGYSYEFVVGYRYNQFTITPGEKISWIDQDAAIQGEAENDTQTKPATGKYSWWKNAIHDAIPRANEPYTPEFHITNEAQFLEFIDLVNGTAGEYGRTNNIYRLVKEYTTVKNPNGTISKVPKTYGWSRVNDEKNAVWVEKEDLEDEGFIFYDHYHPAEGDKAAYSVEDYLRGSDDFHDAGYDRSFTVYLDADLDFKDIKIDAVGTQTNPFRGFFEGAPTKIVQLDADGNMMFTDAEDPRIAYTTIENPVAHTISNLNIEGGYLFGYVKDSAIRNLMLRSYHTIGLLNTATPSMDGDKVIGWGCNIVGISVKANNTTADHNAIAKSLTGLSYVVGCIHEGDATGALVGTADNMTMYGCIRTADNISGGALLGAYADAGDPYLAPTVPLKPYSNKPTWSRFMCNYYNKDIREASNEATAIGGIADNYSVWYYIRGCVSRILCAQNDNLIDKKVSLSSLTDQQVREFYGLAPWRAMNYAIYKYNTDASYPGKNGHECRAHYQVGSVGYDHTYPQLVSGKPGDECDAWNVLKQTN